VVVVVEAAAAAAVVLVVVAVIMMTMTTLDIMLVLICKEVKSYPQNCCIWHILSKFILHSSY
jgi:hypothetical protein